MQHNDAEVSLETKAARDEVHLRAELSKFCTRNGEVKDVERAVIRLQVI